MPVGVRGALAASQANRRAACGASQAGGRSPGLFVSPQRHAFHDRPSEDTQRQGPSPRDPSGDARQASRRSFLARRPGFAGSDSQREVNSSEEIAAKPPRAPKSLNMKIGILGGTGKEGSGLALRLARGGHQVIIGSRDEERARGKSAEL